VQNRQTRAVSGLPTSRMHRFKDSKHHTVIPGHTNLNHKPGRRLTRFPPLAQRAPAVPGHRCPLPCPSSSILWVRSDAHHLFAAPVEGVSLPEPAAVAAYEAHTAVTVGEVGPPHQGAVPENPQGLGVAILPGSLRGWCRGRRGGQSGLGCGLLLHGAGHRDGPKRPPGAGLRRGHGRTDGRAHLAWHQSVAPAEWPPQEALFKPSGREAPAYRSQLPR
jgi:hypothetical protein